MQNKKIQKPAPSYAMAARSPPIIVHLRFLMNLAYRSNVNLTSKILSLWEKTSLHF